MSCGYLASQNLVSQNVAINGTINMGQPVRRKGCVPGTSTPYANTNGANTTLSSRGRCSEYFDINSTFVVTPTAAGTVVITMFQDGVSTGFSASATVAAAATTVTLPVVGGVKINPGTTSSNITYVLTGAAATVNAAFQTVQRED